MTSAKDPMADGPRMDDEPRTSFGQEALDLEINPVVLLQSDFPDFDAVIDSPDALFGSPYSGASSIFREGPNILPSIEFPELQRQGTLAEYPLGNQFSLSRKMPDSSRMSCDSGMSSTSSHHHEMLRLSESSDLGQAKQTHKNIFHWQNQDTIAVPEEHPGNTSAYRLSYGQIEHASIQSLYGIADPWTSPTNTISTGRSPSTLDIDPYLLMVQREVIPNEMGTDWLGYTATMQPGGYMSPGFDIDQQLHDQIQPGPERNSAYTFNAQPSGLFLLRPLEASGSIDGELSNMEGTSNADATMDSVHTGTSLATQSRWAPSEMTRGARRRAREMESQKKNAADVPWRSVIPREGMLGPEAFNANFDGAQLTQEDMIKRTTEVSFLVANVREDILDAMPVMQYQDFDVTPPPRRYQRQTGGNQNPANDGPRANNAVAEWRVQRIRDRNNDAAKKCRARKDQLVKVLYKSLSTMFVERHFWKIQAINRGVPATTWDQIDPRVIDALLPTDDELDSLQRESRTNQLSRAAVIRCERERGGDASEPAAS